MTKKFQVSFKARWADMDFNGHMKNTAFLDYAADSRMLFFKKNGFSLSTFSELQIGPVVFSDFIRYYNELFMYQDFFVSLLLKRINSDGSKFVFVNEFYALNDVKLAAIESEACWLNLRKRKITAPPQELFNIIIDLEKTRDFKKEG